MEKERLAAFSDGVIAIIITIMVLELKPPETADWSGMLDIVPELLSYVLSFVYVAIYWNNHHHMLHMVARVNGGILWANMHLLFWLSLIPFTTAWMWHHHHAAAPVALYGVVLLMAAIAYYILQSAIICAQGAASALAKAIGRDIKGRISPFLYASAAGSAIVSPHLALAIYAAVALMWLVPDRRIEKAVS
ncbi:MAG: DUF1211 domain-containing protein [Alphaproteobacteria bacterium]|nr:DUF1211 domain-containing protein [Alphaproteobacteria bacterium]